jgi:hypothetical protein
MVLVIRSGTLKEGDVWQFAGVKFSIVHGQKKGTNFTYTVLAQPPTGPRMKLFFDESNGIWGIQLAQDGELFLAENNCGLGCSRKGATMKN